MAEPAAASSVSLRRAVAVAAADAVVAVSGPGWSGARRGCRYRYRLERYKRPQLWESRRSPSGRRPRRVSDVLHGEITFFESVILHKTVFSRISNTMRELKTI